LKFPISTRFDNGEPRLLLVAVDVQEATPVVFESYEMKMEQENLNMENTVE
jgi:hypothetical protein